MITFEKKTQVYSIAFDEKGRIASLIYDGKQFVKEPLSLLVVRIRRGNDFEDICSSEALNVRFEEKNNSLCVSFTGFSRVEINLKAILVFSEKKISFSFSIKNHSDNIIEWIECPSIATAHDLLGNNGKAKVLFNSNEGGICIDARIHKYIEPEYPSEGLMGVYPAVVETQFMAYYEEDGAGLYMGAHDPFGNLKAIDFHMLDDETIKFHFRVYCAVLPQSDYSLLYEYVWEFFKGDWQDAAEIYRNWLESTLPTEFKKIEDDESLPEWYKQSFVVLTYPIRGKFDTDVMAPNKLYPYKNALPHIRNISTKTESDLLVLLMHWEGTAPWAPPYVWPPYGDENEFREFIKELHIEGHKAGVYCSGLGFTIKSNITPYKNDKFFEENNLAKFMCTAPDQSLPYSKICMAQRSGYDMCVSQEFTQKTIENEVVKMVDAGLDYIQVLDQNHGGTPYFCYSETHGHPSVPGKWQVDAMKKLLISINEKAKQKTGRTIMFGCESAAAEPYIPYLRLNDNRYNLNYFGAEPKPAYSYVFHPYINNFAGNGVCSEYICDRAKSPEVYLMNMAYCFVAGDLFTLVMNEDGNIIWNWGYRGTDVPNQESIFNFVKHGNSLRKREAKYLCFGKMIKNPAFKTGEHLFYSYSYINPIKVEDVFFSTWLASDGSKATVFANFTDKAAKVEYFGEYGSGKVYDASGAFVSEIEGGQSLVVSPENVCILKYNEA